MSAVTSKAFFPRKSPFRSVLILVESVKTGSDLHAPMNGVVTEINEALLAAPEGINDKPYAAWIFKFEPADVEDTSHFLTAEAYQALINV